jgi:hypothetical protein
MRTRIMLVLLLTQLAACSLLQQDRRDAPWDPKGSRQLIDQIPNWNGGANRVCCGHLRQCEAHQTPRC